MRNLLMTVVVLALLGIASCINTPPTDPPTNPPDPTGFEPIELAVNIISGDVFKEVNQTLIKKVSIVAGFEHQYDTCKLLLTNLNPDLPDGFKQFRFSNPTEPSFNNLGLSLDQIIDGDTIGVYNFYINTNDDPDTISSVMSASWYTIGNDTLRQGITEKFIEGHTEQSLVIIDKSLVDGVPTIKVGEMVGLMSQYGNFYYAYVLGGAIIQMSVNNTQIQKQTPYIKGAIFNYSPFVFNLKPEDPFKIQYRI